MGDFARPLDSTNNKANVLFNKYLGYAYSGATQLGLEYQNIATPKIPKSMIMADDIPDTISDLGTVTATTVSINYKLRPVDTLETKSYTRVVVPGSYQYIVRYRQVPLFGLNTNPNKAFIYREYTSAGDPAVLNLLQNIIAPNFGDKISYSILVEAQTSPGVWSPIPMENYILDRDAGVLTLYNYTDSFANQTNPPRISFWRYEGTFGTINRATDAVFGKTGNDAFYDLGSVAIGKQSVNTIPGTSTKFSLDVSGSLNVDGVILQNGVPITGVLDQNPAYNFTTAENAPGIGIDASGAYAVNAPGVSDGRDNYTSAIYKIDNWIYNYMMAKPPKLDDPKVNLPNDLSGIQGATELIFLWKNNPTQYKFAFTSKSLPAIDTISAQFDISGSLSNQPILTNNTQFITDVSGINALILSKNPGSTGYTTRNINGVDRKVYVYYSSDIASAADDIKVRVWYNNSANGVPNIMDTYTLGQFIGLFPPSQVQNVTNSVVLSNSANIAWNEPQYVASSTIDYTSGNYIAGVTDGAPLYDSTAPYKITYTQTATERYGDPAPQITDDFDAASPLATGNKLASKTTYRVGVSAKNAVNNSYGSEGITTLITPLPADTTTTITSKTINFNSYTNTSNVVAINDQNTAIIGANIVLTGTTVASTLPITNLAVCNTATYASDDNATLTDGNKTANLGAFGSLTTITNTDDLLVNYSPAVVDVYASDNLNSGLFANLPSTQINLYPGSAGYGSAGTSSHTITYTHTVSKGGVPVNPPYTKSVTYYVDSLPTTGPNATATVSSVLLNQISSGIRKVCGISVVGGIPITQTMNNIVINNAGKYFFNNTANGICSIAVSGATGISGTDNLPLFTVGVDPTTVPAADVITVCPNTGSVVTNQMQISFTPNATTRRIGIPLRFIPHNLNGAGTPYDVTIPVVVDQKAYNFVNPQSEPSPIGTATSGMRVHFTTEPTPSSLGVIGEYDMTKSLTADYPTELLYADGKYMYKTLTNNIYADYSSIAEWGNTGIDYTSISTELGTKRGALFSWEINNTSTGLINTLEITLEGMTGLSYDVASSTVKYNNNFDKVNVMYRLEEFDGNNSAYAVTNNLRKSTIWIDAFTKDTTDGLLDMNKAKDMNRNTILGGFLGTSMVNSNTVKVFVPPITPSSDITNKIKIHVLVEIASDGAIDASLTSVKCKYYS